MFTVKTLLLSAGLILNAAALSSCGAASAPNPEQQAICETSSVNMDDNAKFCKAGQKIVFLPQSFGNEQLPILFSAGNCDLRYSVSQSKGGVTCIFLPVDRNRTVSDETPSNNGSAQ